MDSELLTIEQVAEHTGLSAHTLRYYERIGLLDPVGRATSGHRRYAAWCFDIRKQGCEGKGKVVG